MAEYIDRDKTIAEIDDCFPANPTSEFSKGVAGGLAMAKVAVNHTPAADVRPVKWKSVREHTPEPGRYLTCRKTSTIPHSYYQSILSYTDNLESVDEYDFEGENVPGWFEYDSEYGHYSCDNVEWFMPLPPMPINCGAKMEES